MSMEIFRAFPSSANCCRSLQTCTAFYVIKKKWKHWVLLRQAFANPEDALRHGGLVYHRTDPDVERSRRAHRNDMENIFPFLFLGAIYSLMEPNLHIAHVHFLVFFVARVVHSVAYLFALKAPTRSLAYIIGQIPCVSIALQILVNIAAVW
ncbi:prostaglandin E synthase isoform X1 [Narcine bancroftii]|uniref:prostaglandin E synthase isoform X1 n=1 Tax=Narcine bancroftii TaxID=1343680 RepID=UPI0038317DD5